MPPFSKIGPIDTADIRKENEAHSTFSKYTKDVDSEGAKSLIQKEMKKQEKESEETEEVSAPKSKKRTSRRQTASEAMWKSFLRRFGSAIATLCISFIRSFLKGKR